MPTSSNVSTGKPRVSGAIYRAAKGTALPTDAKTALASTYKELGYVSEDGVTNSNELDSENIKAWGGQVVLVTVTEKTDSFTFSLIESLNLDVLKAVYGDGNVTQASSGGMISVTVNANEVAEAVYIIDVAMANNMLKRIVIPAGKLGELGDVVYKDDEPVAYEVTINCMPDASGNNHYEYIEAAS